MGKESGTGSSMGQVGVRACAVPGCAGDIGRVCRAHWQIRGKVTAGRAVPFSCTPALDDAEGGAQAGNRGRVCSRYRIAAWKEPCLTGQALHRAKPGVPHHRSNKAGCLHAVAVLLSMAWLGRPYACSGVGPIRPGQLQQSVQGAGAGHRIGPGLQEEGPGQVHKEFSGPWVELVSGCEGQSGCQS